MNKFLMLCSDCAEENVEELNQVFAENERLRELCEADKREIGSYVEETGLRGEVMNKDAELDAAELEIDRLRHLLVEALEIIVANGAEYEN